MVFLAHKYHIDLWTSHSVIAIAIYRSWVASFIISHLNVASINTECYPHRHPAHMAILLGRSWIVQLQYT